MRTKISGLAVATAVAIAVLFSLSVPARAVPFATFTTPDAALPADPGTGLSAEVWTGINVNTLAGAQAFVGANAPDSTFTATTVDYPKGLANTTGTGANFGTLLGSDAASLSVDITGTTILNSIMRFTGFIAVASTGSQFFELGTDDGSEFIIQGTQVIDNDGIHAFPGAGSGPVEIDFTTTGLYAIEILFFESQASQYGIEFTDGGFGTGDIIATSRLYAAVDEPASFALMLIGLLGGLLTARRAKRR